MTEHDERWDDEEDGWLEPDGEDDGVIAREGELTPLPWSCASCGEENETLLDLDGGYDQQYTEDCAVCCRPNLLRISVDPDSMRASLANELEYE